MSRLNGGRCPLLHVYLSVLFVSLLVSGCYRYHLSPTISPNSKEPLPAATHVHSVTLNSYFWGLVEERRLVKDCMGNGLAQVTVRTNYGYSLLSIATLGIWVPMQIEWKCAKDRGDSDIGMLSETPADKTPPAAGKGDRP